MIIATRASRKESSEIGRKTYMGSKRIMILKMIVVKRSPSLNRLILLAPA
jgi:hypothetical protein